MSGTHKSLIVAIVMCLGLWGCARGPVSTAAAERMKVLEYKVARLEDNLQAAAASRDELDQKLVAAEKERARLEGEIAKLKVVVRERDDLKKQFVARTLERDNLKTQYDLFRKSIRDLLGQAEASLVPPAPSQPVTVAATHNPGKS